MAEPLTDEELEEERCILSDECEGRRQSLIHRSRMVTHCDNCGSDWVDNGINSGCSCKRIAELDAENAKLREHVAALEAELSLYRDYVRQSGEQEELELHREWFKGKDIEGKE